MNNKQSTFLMVLSLLAGSTAIIVVKLVHPELSGFSGLIMALFHKESIIFVYLLALFVFVFTSYIIILVGFIEIFKKIKMSMKNHFRLAYDWNDEDLTYTEIIIFVGYTIISLVLLVFLFPALSVILIFLLILAGFKN